MAITFVNSVSAGAGAGGGDITTAADDMSAADFLVAGLAWKAVGGGADDILDSQSNTYTKLTPRSSGSDVSVRIDYKAAPSVSATHTFTGDVTPTGTSMPSVFGAGFSGVLQVAPFDTGKESGANATAQSISAGTITPSVDGALLIALLGVDRAAGAPVTVNNGFTLMESVVFVTAQHQELHAAYLIQTTAAAISCTFSWPNFANVASVIAAFKPAAGATIRPILIDGRLVFQGLTTRGLVG